MPAENQGYEEEPEEEKIEMGKQNDNNSMDIQNVNLEFETNETKELKDKLRKHFMGAIEKYLFFDRFPWNLCIQVIKLILITIQLVMFGNRRIMFVEYVESNNVAMRHLFLLHWSPAYETMPYPPITGPYAIYTSKDLVDHINFAMKQFSQTESLTLGPVRFPDGGNGMAKYLYMCVEQCREGEGDVFKNGTYSLDQHVLKDCVYLIPERGQNTERNFDIMAILKKNNISLVFDRILKIELKFTLKSYRISVEKAVHKPECYRIDGMVVFDNTNKNGQMVVHLSSSLKEFICGAEFDDVSTSNADICGIALDGLVIFFCGTSFCLCIRSLINAYRLYKETVEYMNNNSITFTFYDKFEFVNIWHLMILINDVLFISGSIVKILLENKHAESSSEIYDICALLLGIGSGLAYMGIIRHIAYFDTYNILTVVLRKAFFDLMKFLVTAFSLYSGALLCGWAILGPYHIKFRNLYTASECLFSLINGDEMFTTFSATVTNNTVIWYFSRFYIYTFSGLFIYAALNLFVAVILGTYKKIKST
ncbi:mucolipin-3-like isoform X2 [Crassostrea virginica]